VQSASTKSPSGVFVHAEGWETKNIDLNGWPAKLASYRVGDSYIATLELTSFGSTIATVIATTREEAHEAALKNAEARLRGTRLRDAHLTVGG
jgi:hypothetical protein